ncbi:unnamed protein product [Echinostoma caproni]|uniref:MIP-T3_C domain-containing protein n=1 Tax=Echinostoma caproni TaxID=27848 RepID=A0A183B4R9_9TREM|nr:unnamed protein product [Echinostoma caproni]
MHRTSGSAGQRTVGLIITEAQQESDDDDDAQFVIEETVSGDTGGLVNKMLQSKREFEGGNLMPHVSEDLHTMGTVDELSRQRERAQIEKEVTKLCETLQTLSRSAMPLGKLMDFVQEDLESMQQEYERWASENQSLKIKLREEESRTQAAIEPLKAQLKELQNYAAEQRKAISTFKAKILTNEERIQDLLAKSLERAH